MPDANVGSALLVYGPLGIFVALFAFGLVFSKSSIERERELVDKVLASNTALATSIDRLSDSVLRDRAGG